MQATAKAYTNIALIKYFGKCDEALNLPAAPSLSLTLDQLYTQTQVEFLPSLSQDEFWLNHDFILGKPLERVSSHLRRMTNQIGRYAKVTSFNNFPTAAGLASSASGFAALTIAIQAALHQNLEKQEKKELSIWARQGSGSAARSLFGGLVLLKAGIPGQVNSSFAEQILPETEWPELRLVIGIISEEAKSISSTEAMKKTAQTSSYYPAFISNTQAAIHESLFAISKKDIEKLGILTEQSALWMHAAAMAANPGIIFFKGPTIEALHALRNLRRQGIQAWFTCDAGPHPKALTLQKDASSVMQTFLAIPGIQRVIVAQPGPDAHFIQTKERVA